MAIDFPNSPTNGQTYTVGDRTWIYDGEKWNSQINGAVGATGATGPTGPTGPTGAAGATGSLPAFGYSTGKRITQYRTGSGTSLTFPAQVTYYMPLVLTGSVTFDRISVRTGTAFSGTATVRLGVYNHDSTTGLPSTVKFDAGTVSATAALTTYDITINQTLTSGFWWLAMNSTTAAATNTYTTSNSTQIIIPIAQPMNATMTMEYLYSETGVTGAFATAGTLANATTVPVVGLRVA